MKWTTQSAKLVLRPSMFPCVCSVIDHRWRQKVSKTKKVGPADVRGFFPVSSAKRQQQETKVNCSFISSFILFHLTQQDCVLLVYNREILTLLWEPLLSRSPCLWNFKPNPTVGMWARENSFCKHKIDCSILWNYRLRKAKRSGRFTSIGPAGSLCRRL